MSVSAAAHSGAPTAISVVADPEHTITPRQLELLALYASGYSYEDIGRMKFLSPHTVKWHLARALDRSHARNLAHLCVLLIDSGMIRHAAEHDYEPVQDLRIVSE
jgi:DNA-binding CsgD family transcriptional regulator